MSNPTTSAAKALRQAANAVYEALDLLASSLEAAAVEMPASDPVPEEKAGKPEAQVEEGATLEQIRDVLSTLSRDGRTAEARAFLKKLGYAKLTEIPEQLYNQVLPAAKELLND